MPLDDFALCRPRAWSHGVGMGVEQLLEPGVELVDLGPQGGEHGDVGEGHRPSASPSSPMRPTEASTRRAWRIAGSWRPR